MILGEGKERSQCEALAKQLGIADDVKLPGFIANPYAYLHRAKLFVLSSRWEGSPNALTEAMALGIPVVATDCPSGPHEILQGGRLGKLVAVGDADALAQAMVETIKHPPSSSGLQAAVSSYTIEASTSEYLRVLEI
jgi:glycosyltransferase involved in cell wall biosynthesis